MFGLSQFRVGQAVAADKSYLTCVSISKFVGNACNEIALMAQANMALSKVHQKLNKDAGDLARLSVETAERYYTKESPLVSPYVRILLAVYLRSGDVGRSERLIKTSERYFTAAEVALYKAGIKYASGLIPDAKEMLNRYVESKSQPVMPSHNKAAPAPAYDPGRALMEQPLHEAEMKYNLSGTPFLSSLRIIPVLQNSYRPLPPP